MMNWAARQHAAERIEISVFMEFHQSERLINKRHDFHCSKRPGQVVTTWTNKWFALPTAAEKCLESNGTDMNREYRSMWVSFDEINKSIDSTQNY